MLLILLLLFSTNANAAQNEECQMAKKLVNQANLDIDLSFCTFKGYEYCYQKNADPLLTKCGQFIDEKCEGFIKNKEAELLSIIDKCDNR